MCGVGRSKRKATSVAGDVAGTEVRASLSGHRVAIHARTHEFTPPKFNNSALTRRRERRFF
jgi:hypothetical protein